jgi:AcrR family transcriptional regulator
VSTPEQASTRARIVQTALELFSAHGYDGTSLRQVAEKMGFTKAALYYHFESKEALAREVLLPIVEDLDALLDRTEQPRSTQDVETFLGAYVDVVVEHRQLVRFAFSDVSVVTAIDMASRLRKQGLRMRRIVLGDKPSVEASIRLAVAFTGINGAVAVSDDPSSVIAPVLLESGIAALGLPREQTRRRPRGQ